MIEITSERLPILVWAEPEDMSGFDEAIAQAKNLANHPIAVQHVALMPDFHVGYGMPIGGVFATQGGVVPNAVGVDIGCGMIACRTEIEADSLTREELQRIREAVHQRVPVGNKSHGSAMSLWQGAEEASSGLPVIERNLANARRQIGTLGGGNHFIELQRDEEARLWLMLHSGSRNIGKQVCDFYDAIAKSLWTSPEPHHDLAYLPEGEASHDEYLASMRWCLRFAEESRGRMLEGVVESVRSVLGRQLDTETPIQTHHNYAALETHSGEAVMVHRKGAVRADGPLIIPGSMGTASYIADGKASPLSFETCSHGAGRVMGRKQANRTISHEQAVRSMEGVVFGIRQGDYEEMPAAYKDIHRVIENQRDLVEPRHILRPLAVVKG